MTNSRNYEAELLGAFEYAPVALVSLSASPESGDSAADYAVALVNDEGVIANHNRHNALAVLPDGAPMNVNFGWQTPRNAVAVQGEEEFTKLLETAVDLADTPDYDIADTVRHEASHTEAWKSVGARTCRYEVALVKLAYSEEQFREGDFEMGFQSSSLATNVVIPKLAVAAMNVRPYNPSGPDKAAAISLGYSGITEIGDRIHQYNQDRPYAPLLLPLSYE